MTERAGRSESSPSAHEQRESSPAGQLRGRAHDDAGPGTVPQAPAGTGCMRATPRYLRPGFSRCRHGGRSPRMPSAPFHVLGQGSKNGKGKT
jgi:hypothetical protein